MTSDVIKAAAVVLEDCFREAVLDLVASCDTIVELEALIEAAEVVQVVYFQIIYSAIVILKNFEMKPYFRQMFVAFLTQGGTYPQLPTQPEIFVHCSNYYSHLIWSL